ncbi:MAG TPA: RNA methyltransferase [Coxiellaceae bacterium]|nr:RNA methyltransferase [Coxiellaceae bacterium]
MLDNIRIVLVETSHPGNIGATARAMKNMGLSRLVLVNPKHFPDHRATERAAGADDILNHAHVVHSLEDAIIDCQAVVATSARSRTLQWPVKSVREAVEWAWGKSAGQVAIVFGNEQSGLSNQQLSMAHIHLQIPTAENFSSLNLGAAVQVVAYELFQSALHNPPLCDRPHTVVSTELMEGFYHHLEETLHQIQFLNRDHPRLLMRRLRRLFARAEMDTNELNILRGILSQVNKKCSNRNESVQ